MDFGTLEPRDLSCLSLWGQYRGGRDVGETVLPPERKRYRRGVVPRDVSSVLLMDVIFGVTLRVSGFGGCGFSSLGCLLDILGHMIHPLWYLDEWEGSEA